MKVTKQETGTVEKISRDLDTAMDHLRAYRTRQDAIVLVLGEVQRAIHDGYLPTAKDKIDELLATTLKQSKERVGNLMLALKVAVDEFKITKQHHIDQKNSQDSLSKIKLLAPEEFSSFEEKEVGPVA